VGFSSITSVYGKGGSINIESAVGNTLNKLSYFYDAAGNKTVDY